MWRGAVERSHAGRVRHNALYGELAGRNGCIGTAVRDPGDAFVPKYRFHVGCACVGHVGCPGLTSESTGRGADTVHAQMAVVAAALVVACVEHRYIWDVRRQCRHVGR